MKRVMMRSKRSKSVALGAVGALLLTATSAGVASAASAGSGPGAVELGRHHQERGRLLSVTEVAALSPAQVQAAVVPFFGDTKRVHYAVTDYRITYSTIDPHGRPTTASGLVVLPTGAGSQLNVISYDHGTNPTRDAVASVTAGDGDREAVELFASAGYAGVAPDYLGLGTGPGDHPYMDLASEVTASQDMLTASRDLAGQHDARLNPRVLVTGFSQGGAAAMGFAHALQQGQAGGYWRLGAVAPMSGPYAVRTAEIPALLHNTLDPESEVLYISYWTVAMNRLHHLYDNPAEVFQQPYASIVEGLYDGDHSEQDILSALPGSPSALLTPQYIARLQHPSGALLNAMKQNDISCDWHPNVPTQIYAADGDKDVAFANAQQCQAQLAAHGVQVKLVDVGDVDHNTSAELATPQVLAFFSEIEH
ncbi:alpha/beta hydrolase family protein [Catenulispora pinisilvae]|uniref:alpha/beta hydrolase family protein n=1 Tax=Catenulispora pinisilvae TaxID=2705253 RepID=UPI0018919057|nr:alpha/beta hydrolase [Catenulispora pinisilvae]